MFWNRYKEKADNLEDTVESLRRDKEDLLKDIENLKLKKKLDEEDIKHMVKIKEERLAIQNEKAEHERERKLDAKIASVKQEYQDKLTDRLEGEVTRIQEMYGEILQRLPNIDVTLNKDLSNGN